MPPAPPPAPGSGQPVRPPAAAAVRRPRRRALALSAWLTLTDRGEALYRVLVTDNAERIANLVELLDGPDEGDRARRRCARPAAAVHPPRSRLGRQPGRGLAAGRGTRRRAARAARRRPAAGGQPQPRRGCRQRQGRGRRQGRRAPSFFVQVGLADGGTVSFLYVLPRFIGAQPVRLLAALALVSVIVLAVSVLAVRRADRPLARFRRRGARTRHRSRAAAAAGNRRSRCDAAIAFNDMQARCAASSPSATNCSPPSRMT